MDDLSLRLFPRMGEGAYNNSNDNKSVVDDFTTQNSSISEDQETLRLSLSPDSTHATTSYTSNQESKIEAPKIEFSFIDSTNRPICPKKTSFSSSPSLISFTNNKEPQKLGHICNKRERMAAAVDHEDHIVAERKRREKISQRFVALSAILPDLKKVDKASILEKAIKRVKDLQEKVQLLEEEQKKTISPKKSVMFVKKYQLELNSIPVDDDDEINDGSLDDNISADIEARFSDNDVLIRITCARRNGFLQNIYEEIEKLHLTIVQSCMMPFGEHTVDFTVVAQMDESFSMTLNDLVKHVRMVTGRLMNQA